jgi:hypothetical protein
VDEASWYRFPPQSNSRTSVWTMGDGGSTDGSRFCASLQCSATAVATAILINIHRNDIIIE